jgi:hypothetical protein
MRSTRESRKRGPEPGERRAGRFLRWLDGERARECRVVLAAITLWLCWILVLAGLDAWLELEVGAGHFGWDHALAFASPFIMIWGVWELARSDK